jgi:hypothetical protein
MMIKNVKDARNAVGAGLKKKACVRSKRVREIFAVLKEQFDQFSQDTAAQNPFPGGADDAALLKQAYDEISGNKTLSEKTETALRPVFRRMGWRFPNPVEGTDSSTVFGSNHLWGRTLLRSLAQLEADCTAGGSKMIEIEAGDAAFLKSVQLHLENDGVSDNDLQKALGIIRKYVKRV